MPELCIGTDQYEEGCGLAPRRPEVDVSATLRRSAAEVFNALGDALEGKRHVRRRRILVSLLGLGGAAVTGVVVWRGYPREPWRVLDDFQALADRVRPSGSNPDVELGGVMGEIDPAQFCPPTPTPTELRATPPSTAVQLPSACIEHAWCEGNLIRVRFTTHNLASAQVAWAFATAKGNPRWYPSDRPVSFAEGRWHANLAIGATQDFTIYVLILDSRGREAVEKYLTDRRIDGQWQLGMVEAPAGAVARAEWKLTCPGAAASATPPSRLDATPLPTTTEESAPENRK